MQARADGVIGSGWQIDTESTASSGEPTPIQSCSSHSSATPSEELCITHKFTFGKRRELHWKCKYRRSDTLPAKLNLQSLRLNR